MGMSVEACREVGHGLPRHSNVGDFSFPSCRSLRAAMELGIHKHAYSAETSVEALFERRDCTNGVSSAGCGEGLCGAIAPPFLPSSEGGDEAIEWVSPRISFSYDLLMVDESAGSRACTGFPEKRKRQDGAENRDCSDGLSADFEFSSKAAIAEAVAGQPAETMLCADELFSEGKLIPMVYVQKMASPAFEFDTHRKWRSAHGEQTHEINGNKTVKPVMEGTHPEESISVASPQKTLVRHLSMELPRLNPSSSVYVFAPPASVSVDSSPCSSPTRSPSVLSNTGIVALSASPAVSKAGSKYASVIKEFFKPKRVSSSAMPQLTRDNSMISSPTCRIPMPPRSFWPFLRSNSAAESKTAPVMIPQRSLSAGNADASRLSNKSDEESILEGDKIACMTDVQAATVSSSEEEPRSLNLIADANLDQGCMDTQSTSDSTETARQVDGQRKDIVCSPKLKFSGSPGQVARRRYSRIAANFLRGSPGRRGGMSSLAKTNGSRIVLRNLERCTADRKLCRETSSRRTVAYPVVMRVSPVINVAVYRGRVPSSSMFGLKSLFSSKKDKVKQKVAGMNNWRVNG